MWRCVGGAWRPQIGDPYATGWLTVLAYLACFGLSLAVWRRLRGRPGRGFWGLIAALMLFLAINKQLDLQSAMTAIGRCMAQAQGWYENRHIVQVAVIGAILAVMLLVLVAVLRAMRAQLEQNLLAVAGLMIQCAFIAIRAVGYSPMDALIGHRVVGLSANFLLENIGLLLIAANAIMILRRG